MQRNRNIRLVWAVPTLAAMIVLCLPPTTAGVSDMRVVTGSPPTTATTGTVAPPETVASTSPTTTQRASGNGTEGESAGRYGGPASPTTRPAPPPPVSSTGAIRSTDSTVYCENGATASGVRTHGGSPRTVSVNWTREWAVYRGTTWAVLDGPMAGMRFRVEDKGSMAHFDMWFGDRPDCRDFALNHYGVQHIRVQRVD